MSSEISTKPVHHIAIGGLSYCGSTLINLCLGSLPGAAAVGETSAMIPDPTQAIPDFKDTAEELDVRESKCVMCGAECKYFTHNFRASMQRDPSDWAEKIAHLLSAQTLVTSEKMPRHFLNLYPDRNHDLLVLFKHPIKHWRSFKKRRWRKDSADAVLSRWAAMYKQLMDYDVNGVKAFLDFSDFAYDPEAAMKLLTDTFGLTYSDDFKRYWEKDHHYINGNFSIKTRLENAPERLPIVTSRKPLELSEAEKQLLAQTPVAIKTFAAMSSLSLNVKAAA